MEPKARRGRRGNESGQQYKCVQQKGFADLVERGVIKADFQHASDLESFVQDCVARATPVADGVRTISVLDCGCGTGVWLESLRRMRVALGKTEDRFFGFDLTLEMIELAKKRLAPYVPADHLKTGDILADESYSFGKSSQTFDLMFTYDVVQQLPRRLQMKACETMLGRLAPGGVLLVFDHDRWSYYGLKMGLKKFVTRHLRVNLVPRFYTNARYPALSKLARHVESQGLYDTEIRVVPGGSKRALIIRSRAK